MPAQHSPSYDALRGQIEDDYAHFTQDQALEQHQAARVSALAAAQVATEIEAPDLAFRAWTLAAECALAISQKSIPQEKQRWLARTFQDLLAASNFGEQGIPSDWLVDFASVLTNLYERAQTIPWLDTPEAQVGQWFHSLARAVEAFIPIELEDKNSAIRTSEIARLLADLSYLYGTRQAADARSDFAIASARRADALQAWIDALYARYQSVKAEAALTRERLTQAASLEDLEAWMQEVSRPQDDVRDRLANLRETLRNLATTLRRRFRSRTGRLWAAQYLSPMISEFFRDELADIEHAATLFEAIESLKARLLLDYLNTPFRELQSPEIEAQAIDIERQILQFAPERPQDADDPLLHEMRLTSQLPIGGLFADLFGEEEPRGRLLEAVEDLYVSQNAGFSSVTIPYPYQRVAGALEPDEALIEYFILSGGAEDTEEPTYEQSIYILVLTSEGLRVNNMRVQEDPRRGIAGGQWSIDHRQPIEDTPFGRQVVELRRTIQRDEDAKAHGLLRWFYDLLISPVVESGVQPQDYNRWIIVPHAMLHSVPFAALQRGDGRYLVEEVALSISPSASVWHSLQGRAPLSVRTFIGFANPWLFDAKWPPLPQAEFEIEQICDHLKHLDCTRYIAEEATEATALEEIPGKSIIHFATHGDFPESDVIDLHQIVLAPIAGSDGRLHAEELRKLDLDAARLVALSICDGGVYRIGPGDEPYGLIPAVLAAGAENVLGTLWPVEDRIGRAFMIEFYRHLLDQGPAEAHRRACTQLLQNQKSHRDWAAWVLIGPGRPWRE